MERLCWPVWWLFCCWRGTPVARSYICVDVTCFPPLFRLSVFEAIFLSFRQCLLERAVPVRVPGVMIRGQAQGSVSLQQHVCVHLCGCVAALPARHFPKLVSTVLSGVLLYRLLGSGVLRRFLWLTLYNPQVWTRIYNSLVIIKWCRGESEPWSITIQEQGRAPGICPLHRNGWMYIRCVEEVISHLTVLSLTLLGAVIVRRCAAGRHPDGRISHWRLVLSGTVSVCTPSSDCKVSVTHIESATQTVKVYSICYS